jgi:hypothetical protein
MAVPNLTNSNQLGSTTKRSKRWPIWLLGLMVVVPALLPAMLESMLFATVIVLGTISWAFSREPLPASIRHILLPIIGIIGAGMIGIGDHDRYDVLKDIWYIVNGAAAIITGFILMNTIGDFRRMAQTFILSSSVVAAFHLLHFVLHPELLELNATDIRAYAGTGFFAPPIALLLFLATNRMDLRLFPNTRWLLHISILLCAASLALSFSRTELLSILVGSMCVLGWLHFRNKAKVAGAILLMLGMLAIGFSLPTPHVDRTHATFTEKLLLSLHESAVQDYYSLPQINEHWRGYEMARALATYLRGTPPEYVVGRGLGTLVDLGIDMPLGDEVVRYAPILHNGYMFVLVKTGAVGLLLYAFLLIRFLRSGTLLSADADRQLSILGRLLVGLTLVLVVSTYVVGGMFNKSALLPVLILMGSLLAYCDPVSRRVGNRIEQKGSRQC